MIRPERLTIKAQEALRDALELARKRGNPVVNDAHLFAAPADRLEIRVLVARHLLAVLAVDEVRDVLHRARTVQGHHRDDVLDDEDRSLEVRGEWSPEERCSESEISANNASPRSAASQMRDSNDACEPQA